MSNIIKALTQRLQLNEALTPDTISGSIVFDPDFPGFQGHFPGNPILPGACLIETAIQLLACGTKKSLQLSEAANVKFFSPVSPGDKVKLDFNIENASDIIVATGTMLSGKRKICTVKLKMTVVK